MSFSAKWFSADQSPEWDRFIEASSMGTLQHSRRFLSYHLDRWVDRSVLIFEERGRLVALLPAAEDPTDAETIISHPGATYGGLVFDDSEKGTRTAEILKTVRHFLRDHNVHTLLYKSVPSHMQVRLDQVDQYELWRAEAKLVRRDLWSVIDLERQRTISRNRRQGTRYAAAASVGVEVDNSDVAYHLFHKVLSDCLLDRHEASPVHTAGEMRELRDRFPNEIQLRLARNPNDPCLAGAWIWTIGHTQHLQYAGSSELGRRLHANDLLFDDMIRAASESDARYFSLGGVTENSGRALNTGLLDFKAGFGRGTAIQDFYELEL